MAEKIFITENENEFNRKHEAVREAIEQCEGLERLIVGFGLSVTREIVSDCLTLSKGVENRPKEKRVILLGINAEQTHTEYEPVEVFTNTEHIDAAFADMLKAVENGPERPNEKQAKADRLKAEYEDFLQAVYDLFHIQLYVIDTEPLLKYFVIKDGHVSLPEDFGEQLRRDTAIYTESEEGVAAYKLHQKLVEGVNLLFGMMKNRDHLSVAVGIQNLFAIDGEGKVTAAPIDYDLFCK